MHNTDETIVYSMRWPKITYQVHFQHWPFNFKCTISYLLINKLTLLMDHNWISSDFSTNSNKLTGHPTCCNSPTPILLEVTIILPNTVCQYTFLTTVIYLDSWKWGLVYGGSNPEVWCFLHYVRDEWYSILCKNKQQTLNSTLKYIRGRTY